MDAFLVNLAVQDGPIVQVVVTGEVWATALAILEKDENATIQVGEEKKSFEVVGFQKIAPYVE